MRAVAGYDNDIFISYSHIDNQPLVDMSGGWVDVFHEHLQNFVDVHVGRRTAVWRDRRLTGADVLSDEIEQQLRHSAVLVSILSPGYLQSEWCNRELVSFVEAAQEHSNLRIGNLQRVVKVLRLPIERSALTRILDDVLGTQFYRIDPISGRARDLLLDPSADALRIFRARVDDVAQDLSRVLAALTASGEASAAKAPPASADTVFLAWTTGDVTEERERLRRELEARNYRVVPSGPPPLDVAQLRVRVLDALRDATVAIHMIGQHYGYVPEGDERSVIELQCDAGVYRESNSAAARILWIAPDARVRDRRLDDLIADLHADGSSGAHIDVLKHQTVETLKALVLDRLASRAVRSARPARSGPPGVYVMCDQLDRHEVAPIEDFLFEQSFEVRLPLFEGDAEQIRGEHYETLKECDGVLIFWGKAKEGWLRSMLRDLNKVFGLGRIDAFKASALYLADLPDPEKERFRTHQLSILRPGRSFEPDVLHSFVAQLSRT